MAVKWIDQNVELTVKSREEIQASKLFTIRQKYEKLLTAIKDFFKIV